jgi:serine/threonine protein kinase
LCEPYNLSADVYSFGLLLWQICSLELPYDGMSRTDHAVYVVKGNERPALDPSWSTPLRILMKRAWEPDPSLRPSMDSTYKILKREIVALRDGDDSGLEYTRRRSTFVMNRDSVANPAQSSMRNLFRQVSNRNMPGGRQLSMRRLQRDVSATKLVVPERSRSSRALIGVLERAPSKRGAVAA